MANSDVLAIVEERVLKRVGVEDCYSSGEAIKAGIRGESHDQSLKPSASNNIEGSNKSKEDKELELTRAEMGKVRDENERLKMMLEQIQKDYKSLQLRFFSILKQETCQQSSVKSSSSTQETEESELLSLRLGRSTPSDQPKRQDNSSKNPNAEKENIEDLRASLSLGLDSNTKWANSSEVKATSSNPSREGSLEEVKEEEAGETWPPSKGSKRSSVDDAVPQQKVKRARVCVRARCDTPTMNDGCQWRKYGQKIAKGNPCPRAYYRCMFAPACPVRKQVQRSAEDKSILLTTYEGTHNHPLPVSATPMASTTAAASSMLLSGSSTSQPTLGSPSTTELNGLNFTLYKYSISKQLHTPNPSPPMCPTITLDLTTPSTPFNGFSSSFNPNRRFPSSSLNFSSTESNTIPTFGGNNNVYIGNQHQEQVYQPCISTNMERNYQAETSQLALTETLTKAITSDPSVGTVIAAAISTMMGSGNQGRVDGLGQNVKLGECNQPISNNYGLIQNGKGCAPAYFSGLTCTSASQPATLLQSPLPFSLFNSASSNPTNNKEQKS